MTIRLATVDDVSEIRRLIVGLALYEKEPAATVEGTEEDRRDGRCPARLQLFAGRGG